MKMKKGDLVAKIASDWVIKNQWMAESIIAKELFGCTKEVFGIIIEEPVPFTPGPRRPIMTAKVLTTAGNIVQISTDQLEVIGNSE